MQTAYLSSEKHLIIPSDILEACHLNAGQEVEIEITPQGILLKTPNALPRKTSINNLIGCTGYQALDEREAVTSLEALAGCLKYEGKAKTLEEMDDAIRQGIIAEWGSHDSD
jgi:antitoxin component of MazEF toxin-antitoxin module